MTHRILPPLLTTVLFLTAQVWSQNLDAGASSERSERPAVSKLWNEFSAAKVKNDQVALPDFSYAGYHQGAEAIPSGGKIFSVKDYGAIPDDLLDDA
ncbi:MAG: hypothetical protein JNM63_01175, partial [Spirochaetia bacterium]|nr:hypothetical protein [Spirochaetia bacterium]